MCAGEAASAADPRETATRAHRRTQDPGRERSPRRKALAPPSHTTRNTHSGGVHDNNKILEGSPATPPHREQRVTPCLPVLDAPWCPAHEAGRRRREDRRAALTRYRRPAAPAVPLRPAAGSRLRVSVSPSRREEGGRRGTEKECERRLKKKKRRARALCLTTSQRAVHEPAGVHLRGRVAIITGVARIGCECALALARLGCACVIAARRSRCTRRCGTIYTVAEEVPPRRRGDGLPGRPARRKGDERCVADVVESRAHRHPHQQRVRAVVAGHHGHPRGYDLITSINVRART